ncbi:HAD family hydrolase [Stutzerimonas kunmingensis]|uniref:HAD family hydrolase n=1 Tax=Stutzerimonas kunmingensis TaxID=1211807 RepID=UPI00289E11DC|nr:HAD family hydrolase [Stutzerimonas kunmingensis]
MITASRAVIFDAFGTLLKIQGGRHPYRSLLKLGQMIGRRPRPDDAHMLMQEPLTLSEAAARLGIRVKRNELDNLEQVLADEVAGIEPFEDGLSAVALLKQKGIRVGICSNLAYPYREAILRHYPNLDAYAFSCELGVIKPAKEIYRATCQRLRTKPTLTHMIGDSRRCDKDGPNEIGITGHLLDRAEDAGDYKELVSFAQDVLR